MPTFNTYNPGTRVDLGTSVDVKGVQFSFEKDGTHNTETNTTQWKLIANGKPVCYYTSWAYGSCACAALSGFQSHDYNATFFQTTDNIDALIEFLKKYVPAHGGGYNPNEYTFLTSLSQVAMLKKLTSHPNVKKVDSWANKAHGGNPVALYRLSVQKDF